MPPPENRPLLLQVQNLPDGGEGAAPVGFEDGRPQMLAGPVIFEGDAIAPDLQAELDFADADVVEVAALHLGVHVVVPGTLHVDAAGGVDVLASCPHILFEEVRGHLGERHGEGNSIVAVGRIRGTLNTMGPRMDTDSHG
jgi:hypothetical protein